MKVHACTHVTSTYRSEDTQIGMYMCHVHTHTCTQHALWYAVDTHEIHAQTSEKASPRSRLKK